MRCSDEHHYVVKFPNNNQGRRVLANELLCARLAEALSLPVAHGAVVLVQEHMVRYSDEMYIEGRFGRVRCEHGRCFGSRFPVDPFKSAVHDFLPSSLHCLVTNRRDFCGMLVFDTWTSNVDNRQAVFVHDSRFSYRAFMIDQSLAFGGAAWRFTESADAPVRSAYLHKGIYQDVRGPEDFEPWLTRLEEINEDALHDAASAVPPEWYDGDRASMDLLLEQLYERKNEVRRTVRTFGCGFPKTFPNWIGGPMRGGREEGRVMA